jgi:hypothetical protein
MPYCGMQGDNYQRGDYYRGDYYRGDPFIHKKIIGGVKAIGKAVLKLSPAGRVISGAAELAKKFLPGPSAGSPQFSPPGGMMLMPPSGMNGGNVVPSQGVLDVIGACAPGGRLLKGYRWNKSGYFTKGGGTSRWPDTVQYHPAGSTCVKTRRMNVANARALRRALRRASGFAKLARRYVAVQRRFKKKGRRRK